MPGFLSTVKSVYSGILGGVARQLPINLPGRDSSTIPDAAPEFKYLGGPTSSSPEHLVSISCANTENGRKPVNVVAYWEGSNNLSLSSGAQYDAPFDQGLLELVNNDLATKANTVMRLFGIRTVTQSMTSQVWQGSEHISMSLTLLFIAENSSRDEVIDQVKQLMSLTMPAAQKGGSGGSAFLSAPGPRVKFREPEGGGGVSRESISGALGKLSSGLGQGASSLSGGGNSQQTQQAIEKIATGAGDLTALADSIEAENPVSIRIGRFLNFESVIVKSADPQFEEMLDPHGLPIVARVQLTFETHQVPTVQDLDKIFSTGTTDNPGLPTLKSFFGPR